MLALELRKSLTLPLSYPGCYVDVESLLLAMFEDQLQKSRSPYQLKRSKILLLHRNVTYIHSELHGNLEES